MGRIKTTLVKRSAEEFLERHPDSFKSKFNDNKAVFKKVSSIGSKKLKNKILGYITRLVKIRESKKNS